MNRPPQEFKRVPVEKLRLFASECLRTAGLRTDHAEQLAQLLTNNDLRGVRSHGSLQLHSYCTGLSQGTVNPNPQPKVVKETGAAVLVDGDGGLGYAPMMEATELALEKAKDNGIALGATCHIAHYGSAGHYVRRAVDDGFIAYSVQGHGANFDYEEVKKKQSAGYWGNPPFCFGLPAGDEPAMIVDGGTTLMADSTDPVLQELTPAAFFKSMGLTAVSMALGGVFVGMDGRDQISGSTIWPSANMGGMIFLFDVGLFVPSQDFRSGVDGLVRGVRETMDPVKGFDEALLPGTIEFRKEKEYKRDGIPMGTEDIKGLDKLAAELGLSCLSQR